MFEEEAEEYKDNTRIKDKNTYSGFPDERISELQDFEGNYIDISERIIKTFQDGAEFGYNKASEWHYVKDGLPQKDGFYLVAFHNIGCDAVDVGQFLQAEWWHMDEEIRVFINKNIYAWKELPNPPKEI